MAREFHGSSGDYGPYCLDFRRAGRSGLQVRLFHHGQFNAWLDWVRLEVLKK